MSSPTRAILTTPAPTWGMPTRPALQRPDAILCRDHHIDASLTSPALGDDWLTSPSAAPTVNLPI